MRRLWSWLAIAAVLTLAVVAAADGLRGGPAEAETREARPPPSAETQPIEERLGLRSDAEQELFLDNARGLLWIADGGCSIAVLVLPETELQRQLDTRSCTLGVSGDGRLEVAGAAWEPDRNVFARCDVAFVELRTADSGLLDRFPGCAPAWRPDGELTYVVLGELAIRRPGAGSATLLSKGDLAAAQLVPWADSYSVKEAVWLDADTFAAVVRARGDKGRRRTDLVVVFEGSRPLAPPLIAGDDIRKLRASPLRTAVEARVDGEVRILARDGSEIRLPLEPLDALAWSPDEQLVAVSWKGEVVFLRTGRPDGRRVRLPLQARELAWAPPPADPVAATGGVVPERGLLLWADAGCRVHALRFPELAATPAGPHDGCRLGDPEHDDARTHVDTVETTLAGDPAFADRHVSVLESASLGDGRLAAIVALGNGDAPGTQGVVVVEDGRVVRTVRDEPGRLSELAASPLGNYLSIRRSTSPERLLLLDRDGAPISPAQIAGEGLWRPRFRYIRELAWSSDERWLAVASRRSVFLFRVAAGDPSVLRIPVAGVRALAWADET